MRHLIIILALLLTGCMTTIHSQTIEYPNRTRITRTSIYIAGGLVPASGSLPTFPKAQRQLTRDEVMY